MELALATTRLELRPYQLEALEALDAHLMTRDDNPCVVLPTGSGKSLHLCESAFDKGRRYERDSRKEVKE